MPRQIEITGDADLVVKTKDGKDINIHTREMGGQTYLILSSPNASLSINNKPVGRSKGEWELTAH